MILIVDDDYSVTASLGLLFKQKGLPSVAAATPEAALAAAARPDVTLVLQDMNFSRETTGAEGLDLLNKFTAKGVPTVAVFLSGRPLWVNRELYAAGAFVASWLPDTFGGAISHVTLVICTSIRRNVPFLGTSTGGRLKGAILKTWISRIV